MNCPILNLARLHTFEKRLYLSKLTFPRILTGFSTVHTSPSCLYFVLLFSKTMHLTPAHHLTSSYPTCPSLPHPSTPPTLTSSCYVSANRGCARCWVKWNCGMVQGEGESAANASHILRALGVAGTVRPACAPSASLQYRAEMRTARDASQTPVHIWSPRNPKHAVLFD